MKTNVIIKSSLQIPRILPSLLLLLIILSSSTAESSSGDSHIEKNSSNNNNNNDTIKSPNDIDDDDDNCDNTGSSSSLSVMMGLEGNVSECTCSFREIEDTNVETVLPLLKKVVETPFFSHFKIDLCTSCTLWDETPELCMLRECSVCECDEPPSWAVDGVESMPKTGPACQHVEDSVTGITDVDSRAEWSSSTSSSFGNNQNDKIVFDNSFSSSSSSSFLNNMRGGEAEEEEEDANTEVVVDLRVNPERYTGYSGPSAAKVWSAIHSTNCFQPSHEEVEDTLTLPKDGEDPRYCLLPAEQRLYNRVISGLHSSISLHIAHSYCQEIDNNTMGECSQWGYNIDIAYDRVLNYPDRVENLYVAFALLLRAVVKAGEAVTAAVPKEDPYFANSLSNWTGSLLPELTKMAQDCPHTFDESTLLAQPDFAKTKRTELQKRFQHLQKIMQCVGCDRCKLWGTLQTLGIGTALKVLFSDEEEGSEELLSRQEAVALVHTLERLSSSLVYAKEIGEKKKLMMMEETTTTTTKIL